MNRKIVVPSTSQRQQGFSLIETLIALAIFSLGMLAVTAMLTNSSLSNGNARAYTEAAAFASDAIERLRSVPYSDLADGAIDDGYYTTSWTVTNNGLISNSKTIQVTVTHNRKGTQEFSLETVRSNFLPRNPS